MPRLNIQAQDPDRFARVKAEQDELMKAYATGFTAGRILKNDRFTQRKKYTVQI